MGTMTSDLATNLITAAVALSALSIISLAALRGWRDWIQLKREELAAGHGPAANDPAVPHAGSRIEIAGRAASRCPSGTIATRRPSTSGTASTAGLLLGELMMTNSPRSTRR